MVVTRNKKAATPTFGKATVSSSKGLSFSSLHSSSGTIHEDFDVDSTAISTKKGHAITSKTENLGKLQKSKAAKEGTMSAVVLAPAEGAVVVAIPAPTSKVLATNLPLSEASSSEDLSPCKSPVPLSIPLITNDDVVDDVAENLMEPAASPNVNLNQKVVDNLFRKATCALLEEMGLTSSLHVDGRGEVDGRTAVELDSTMMESGAKKSGNLGTSGDNVGVVSSKGNSPTSLPCAITNSGDIVQHLVASKPLDHSLVEELIKKATCSVLEEIGLSDYPSVNTAKGNDDLQSNLVRKDPTTSAMVGKGNAEVDSTHVPKDGNANKPMNYLKAAVQDPCETNVDVPARRALPRSFASVAKDGVRVGSNDVRSSSHAMHGFTKTNPKAVLEVMPNVNKEVYKFTYDEVAKEKKLWEATLIGAVIGANVSWQEMTNYIKNNWKVAAPILYRKSNGIMIFRFGSLDDRNWVLDNGPWLIGGSRPLVFKEWQSGMCINWTCFKSVPAWVRIVDIDPWFVSSHMLSVIGNMIGKPLRLDNYTAELDKVSYARMLVEVNPEEANRKEVVLEGPDGTIYKHVVEFEWLPWKCDQCNSFGHTDKFCQVPSRPFFPPKRRGGDKGKQLAQAVNMDIQGSSKNVSAVNTCEANLALNAESNPVTNVQANAEASVQPVARSSLNDCTVEGEVGPLMAGNTWPPLAQPASNAQTIQNKGVIATREDGGRALPKTSHTHSAAVVAKGPPEMSTSKAVLEGGQSTTLQKGGGSLGGPVKGSSSSKARING